VIIFDSGNHEITFEYQEVFYYVPSIAVCKLGQRPQNFGTGMQAAYMRQVRSALSQSYSR